MKTEDRSRPSSRPRDEKKNESLEWIKSLGVAFLLFMVLRTFFLQAFSIPSGSMERTLLVGDYLFANNLVFGPHIPLTELRIPGLRDPQRGEVVVFRPTYNDPVIDVVKRVIGVPGDTLEMREGMMYRNGVRLDEPYVKDAGSPDVPMQYAGPGGYAWHLNVLGSGIAPANYHPSRENWGPLVVPAENYFLMGDNRDESLDSRFMGFIPREVIRGKPMFIYFSFDGTLERPFPFLTAARWDRIGHLIR